MTDKDQQLLDKALSPIREQIDVLDSQLLDWLEKRIKLIKQVGEIKNSYGAPPLSKTREESILQRVKKDAIIKGIPEELVEDIWKSIFKAAYLLEENHDK